MIKFNKNLIGSGLFLTLSLVLWLMIPYQIILKSDRVINSQTFPRLVIGLMGICSLYLFVREVVNILMKKECEYTVIHLKEESKSLLMIGSVTLFWIMLHWIPFMIAAVIFSGLVLALYRCKKLSYYAITFSTIMIVTVVFEKVLHVNLP